MTPSPPLIVPEIPHWAPKKVTNKHNDIFDWTAKTNFMNVNYDLKIDKNI